MVWIFELKDKTGRAIHLSNERWKHITRVHPDMANYLEEIKETLKNPLKIIQHSIENLRYYHTYLKQRKHPAKYLRIIVKYLNSNGFIITAHFVKNIK